MVMYNPVAVATLGSRPIIIRIGPKIKPGPTPQKAADNEPKKLTPSILRMFGVVACRSPSVNWYL